MMLATFLLLYLPILFPCTASQSTILPVPTITIEISPVNVEVQREGDTVSLLCRVDNFDPERFRLSWYIAHKSFAFSSSNAPYTRESYSSTFERIGSSLSSFNFNLTLNQIAQSDNGAFVCHLAKIVSPSSTTALGNLAVDLRVYPPYAFPICRPEDKSLVVVGNLLECRTNGIATPEVNGSNNDGWITVIQHQSEGALLVKNVMSSDNGRTFVCLAITGDNRMPLSCNIGPLMLVDSLSTTQSVSETRNHTVAPIVTTIANAGLSAADISGIVVGAIVLIILIAIHALCCHCDPRKWMNAKSYLVNLGSSIGTWNQGTDSTRRQSEVEMGASHPEEPDSPPAYNAVVDESHPDFVGHINRPVSIPEPNIYAEPAVAVPNLNINIDLRLIMNIAPPDVASTSGAVDQAPPARKDPSAKIADDISYATVSSTDDGRPTKNMPRETTPAAAYAAVKSSPIPQIYAEVTKPRRSAAENTNVDVRVPSGKSEKPGPQVKPKSVKKFGANKEQNESSDDAAPKRIIYADLNLHGGPGVEGGKIQSSEETPTVYAKIKH